MFSHEGDTSTVSPGSSTPLTLEFVPATACASTEAGRAVSDDMASRPILLASPSVNHRLPSGPAVSATGVEPAGRSGKFGDDPRRRDSSDLVRVRLGEPEVAVGPRRDAEQVRVGGRNGEFGHRAGRRDAADAVGPRVGEPDVAVGPARNALGLTAGDVGRELRDGAGCRDPPDLPRQEFGEPEVAVRAGGDLQKDGRRSGAETR